MPTESFEKYLQDVFMKDFHGTKDQYEDAFDAWLSNLDTELLMLHADRYAIIKCKETSDEIFAELKKHE